MKKIIFASIAVVTIAIIATFNVSFNSQSNNLSDISLANVEALANTEFTSNGWSCFNYGYDDYSYDMFFTYVRCYDCYTSTAISVWDPAYCWH
ncbi:hypothetical protein FACS189474_3270 [Bacteroidia bacterium]|nr:hypothetical protein FACS189440_15140 [Bacteroidia bacterium]GHT88294.1 hypothetical protein FACS189474_3270 [Bacteroidia bacterium]